MPPRLMFRAKASSWVQRSDNHYPANRCSVLDVPWRPKSLVPSLGGHEGTFGMGPMSASGRSEAKIANVAINRDTIIYGQNK